MNWNQITPQKAESLYGIPHEVANDTRNQFFGISHNMTDDYDVPRPLLAFLQNSEHPDIVTVHVQTIEPATWEYRGNLPNPLTFEGGILSVDKNGLNGLLEVLSSRQEQLTEDSQIHQVFEQITPSKLVDFRLHPEWFPKTRQEHYIQIYDPLLKSTNLYVTILILSRDINIPKISIRIRHFPSVALQDTRFEPLYGGHSKINLDKRGFQELIKIFHDQTGYLR